MAHQCSTPCAVRPQRRWNAGAAQEPSRCGAGAAGGSSITRRVEDDSSVAVDQCSPVPIPGTSGGRCEGFLVL